MQEEIIEVDIGKAIKEGLQKKSISQSRFAKTIGVSSALVSAWVGNQRVPTGRDIIKIAILLDIVPVLFPGYAKKEKPDSNPENKDRLAKINQEIEKLHCADRSLEKKIQQLEHILEQHSVHSS